MKQLYVIGDIKFGELKGVDQFGNHYYEDKDLPFGQHRWIEYADIHNPDAKHIVKQSGLTPVERASHTTLLEETGFKDVLRYFYPTARGQFTYWSMRTSARQPNKGIRLDYFICSPSILPEIEINESSTITKTADTDEKEDIVRIQ